MQEIITTAPWGALMVVIPLAAAAASYLFPWRSALMAASAIAFPAAFYSLALLARDVWVSGAVRYRIGGWGSPLGIDLFADGLSILMLFMTIVVVMAASIYSSFYFSGDVERKRSFWPLWMFLWAGLNGVFLSGDVFNLYVTLEVMVIASVALISLKGGREALLSGMRYFLVSVLGSLSYLMGVAMLYGSYGILDIGALGRTIGPDPAAQIAIVLIVTGLLAKTALFPLHFWLPKAHASAPVPVSAALSALVVKAPFYIILRLWTDVFSHDIISHAGLMLGVLGSVAIIWGGVMALRQTRLKMLVAYSTVSQIGYLFLFFPMAGSSDAFLGCVYQALSHGLAKASMFLAAGNLIKALGSDLIEDLRGLRQRLNISTFAFGLAGISLMGLPPGAGFIAKWQLLKASIETGQWWWAIIIVAGGLLAAGYLFPVLRNIISQSQDPVECAKVPFGMEAAAIVLAVLSLVLGIAAAVPLSLFRTALL
ncbi:MAG: oxidoreductase [Nitrospirae bacterium]|nr:oxidoreductase [Nitrospirota bacterium]